VAGPVTLLAARSAYAARTEVADSVAVLFVWAVPEGLYSKTLLSALTVTVTARFPAPAEPFGSWN
jgi:hypothetical protein